eukprot:1388128-Amorphochlora_amoeboformis.AAC.1
MEEATALEVPVDMVSVKVHLLGFPLYNSGIGLIPWFLCSLFRSFLSEDYLPLLGFSWGREELAGHIFQTVRGRRVDSYG